MGIDPGLQQVHLTALQFIFQTQVVYLHLFDLRPYLPVLLQLAHLFLDNIQHIVHRVRQYRQLVVRAQFQPFRVIEILFDTLHKTGELAQAVRNVAYDFEVVFEIDGQHKHQQADL